MGFRNSEGCSQTKGRRVGGLWKGMGEKRSRKSRSSSILPFPHKSLGWKIVRIPRILSLPSRGWSGNREPLRAESPPPPRFRKSNIKTPEADVIAASSRPPRG
ncbi:hypothetical protein AVEN_248647-1 [Araneus ventricosus]|uniref:Uncharacterized protein n=1 Tax=Araneus ventricosus TaxID=182803 RepID=A0A4Y2C0N7_ARAVE|nr:hypothetical protein AVEN_248647-1 [Araneus ventricosus]